MQSAEIPLGLGEHFGTIGIAFVEK